MFFVEDVDPIPECVWDESYTHDVNGYVDRYSLMGWGCGVQTWWEFSINTSRSYIVLSYVRGRSNPETPI